MPKTRKSTKMTLRRKTTRRGKRPSGELLYHRHMDFALAFFSMLYRSKHPEDKEFVTPNGKDLLEYLQSLTKGLKIPSKDANKESIKIFETFGKMSDIEFLKTLKSTSTVRKTISTKHAPATYGQLVSVQAGGGVWDSIKKLAFFFVGGDGVEYGRCGEIFQALALILIGLTVAVLVALIVKGMIGGSTFIASATSAFSSPIFMNGIQDPLRFAMDSVPELLPYYDGLMTGFGNLAMNAISQLSGNAECVAALNSVPISYVGSAVTFISNQIFSGYLYYKCIVVPGSLILQRFAGIDCTAYIAAQKASYVTGTKIFIFEGLISKLAEIPFASEPCDDVFNPFGIAGGGDC